MKTLVLISLFSVYPSSATFPDDCRVRLRYVNFNEMTEREHLLWLNCAFEALKGGEDKYLKTYEEWLGNTPNYIAFQKAWAANFIVESKK